jgi:hypothetical protein
MEKKSGERAFFGDVAKDALNKVLMATKPSACMATIAWQGIFLDDMDDGIGTCAQSSGSGNVR